MAEGDKAGGDTVWLTYTELAERLGITVASAQRRVNRSSWPRHPGNDGKARIGVPPDVLPAAGVTPPSHQTPAPSTTGGDTGDDTTPDNEALSRLMDRLEELEATREKDRAELAAEKEARAAELLALTERHGRELGDLRERIGRAEAEKEAAEVQRVAQLRELESWTSGNPFARALRALLWRRE